MNAGILSTPLMAACLHMIPRTGAEELQLGYLDDMQPVPWVAMAKYGGQHVVAAGLTPTAAVVRLLEQTVDGGKCQHCQRPTGFSPEPRAMPLGSVVCWYQFDPELATIRRGGQGDR